MYAKEAFDRYGADAITVNPYMGMDALKPFLDRADKGVVVLCRTSNAGGKEIQELKVDGVEVYRLITEVFPEQKAILASGFAELARMQEGRKLGMRLHAKKPYTPENLGKVVRMLMAEQ